MVARGVPALLSGGKGGSVIGMEMRRALRVIACDVRSAHNVGSLFRTADGAGAEKVHLVGVSPSPIDRFGRDRSDIGKVALGAERSLPWDHSPRFATLAAELKREGWILIALEQGRGSVDYRQFSPVAKKLALVVGNEVGGLPEEVLRECAAMIEIPMRGGKESLNVSVAAGIALYEIADRLGL